MKTYEFTLTFSLERVDEDPGIYEKALWDYGCDDASIGLGRKGSIALMFDRKAKSAQDAVGNTISNVIQSIPGATLIEVEPELVDLTNSASCDSD